jgi:hypothetical protein
LLTTTFKEAFARGVYQALLDKKVASNSTKVVNVRCGSIVADVIFFSTNEISSILNLVNSGNFTVWVGATTYTASSISLRSGVFGCLWI